MRITRPRATTFGQLSGTASAAQMAANVLAAINASVEVTKIANAQLVDIAWAKVTKTGSSLADLATRSLSDLSINANLAMGAHNITLNVGQTVDGVDISAIVSVPSGAIIIWSGAISAIPAGWVLCDGNNSTPNLTDRFVIHADADAAGTRNVGATGGAMSHTLTIAELAAHTHSLKRTGGSGDDYFLYQTGAFTVDQATGSTGSGNAHSILNKYHALAYIMKT